MTSKHFTRDECEPNPFFFSRVVALREAALMRPQSLCSLTALAFAGFLSAACGDTGNPSGETRNTGGTSGGAGSGGSSAGTGGTAGSGGGSNGGTGGASGDTGGSSGDTGGSGGDTGGTGGDTTGTGGGDTGGSSGTGGGGSAGAPGCSGDWSGFVPPNVHFTDQAKSAKDAKAVEGSKIVAQAVPNMDTLMRDQCLGIAKQIYCSLKDDINNFTDLSLQLEDDPDGVAWKAGDPPSITIGVSAQYIVNYFNDHGKNYKAVADEIRGMLSHEGTHGYQWGPKNAGEYDGSSDFYGEIEGLADYVRISLGLHPSAEKNKGGDWNSGYTTTGFFIQYLTTKDVDFARKLNASARDYPKWSWDLACKNILGKGVQDLWDDYQGSIP
jgi:Peptidase of plants and bacteria